MFLHHPIGKANKAEQNSTPVKTASDYVHQVAVRACWMYVLWLRSCRPLLPIARSGRVGHKTNLFFFLTLDAHFDIYFTLSQTHFRVPTGMESLQIDKVMEITWNMKVLQGVMEFCDQCKFTNFAHRFYQICAFPSTLRN